MMRSIYIISIVLTLVVSAVGCTASNSTPDVIAAIPATGSVTARSNQPAVDLHSGPGSSFSILGKMLPGESARLIGINAAGDWFQIEYKGQIAWVNVPLVDFTIAQ